MIKNSHHTEESKKKMSKTHIGKRLSIETIKKIIESRKGYKHSEETKRKISERHKGRNLTGLKNGLKTRFYKGFKHTKETRLKMSSKRGGENNNNWKGGVSLKNKTERQIIMEKIDYKLWREAVFARDNWTCQKCKTRGYRLVAHHIKNFRDVIELRTSIENGITFCQNCHWLFHKEYGNRKNTKEQLINFIKKYV